MTTIDPTALLAEITRQGSAHAAAIDARRGCQEPSRELHCDDCHRDYPVWSVDNPTWNAVMRANGEQPGEPFLCPTCFVIRCGFRAPLLTVTEDPSLLDTPPAPSREDAVMAVDVALETAGPWWTLGAATAAALAVDAAAPILLAAHEAEVTALRAAVARMAGPEAVEAASRAAYEVDGGPTWDEYVADGEPTVYREYGAAAVRAITALGAP